MINNKQSKQEISDIFRLFYTDAPVSFETKCSLTKKIDFAVYTDKEK